MLVFSVTVLWWLVLLCLLIRLVLNVVCLIVLVLV